MILALFFYFSPCLAADFGASDMKKISDELKRDRQEMERTRQAMKQAEWEKRQVDDAIKRQRDEAKQLQRQLEEEKRSELARRKAEEVRKPNKFVEFIASWPVQFAFYFLVFAGFGTLLYFKVLAPRKKPAEEEPTIEEIGPDVLAAATHWRFREKDFKKYQMKLSALADAKVIDVDSAEFKKYFIRDMVMTEILFQAAVSRKLDSDAVFLAELNKYKDYVSGLNKEGAAFLKLLNDYKSSFVPAAGQRPAYAAYYKGFLDLLMILNANEETEIFELYERFLLINKLAGSGDAAAMQHALDVIINEFKLAHNVIIKEEAAA